MIIKILNNLIIKLLSSFYLVCLIILVYANNNNLVLAAARKLIAYELVGDEVKFDYENYPIGRQMAYEYYIKNYTFDKSYPLAKKDIGIALYDLDNDGKKEIITYLQKKEYCGSDGCKFHILKQASGADSKNGVKYFSITQGHIYSSIKVLDTKTFGYHDLLIDDKKGPYLWSWNKISYKNLREIKENQYGKKFEDDAFSNQIIK